jgi:thiol-disulfide isomerase/thioredoxin
MNYPPGMRALARDSSRPQAVRPHPPVAVMTTSSVSGTAVHAFVVLAILALVLAAAPCFSAAAERDSRAPATFAVPDWRLRATDGREISLHGALAKGPVLVSFWALWCNPCLKELPHLEALASETAGRLTVLAVNQDGPRSVARVRPYLRSKGLGLTVPLDTSGDVGRKMQIGGALPFLVLYDARGREVYRNIGYREGNEVVLREKVMALLGGSGPDSAAVP